MELITKIRVEIITSFQKLIFLCKIQVRKESEEFNFIFVIDVYRFKLQETDINKALQETQKVEKWLEEQRMKIQAAPKYANPPVTVAQIRQEKQVRNWKKNPYNLSNEKPDVLNYKLLTIFVFQRFILQNFDNLVAPIYNKPKPKPKTEPPPPAPEETNKATGDSVEPNDFQEAMDVD